MVDLVFCTEVLPQSACELCAIVSYDLVWNTKSVHDALQELDSRLLANLPHGFSFNPLRECVDRDKQEFEPSTSIPQIANGQHSGIMFSGCACLVDCFWKN